MFLAEAGIARTLIEVLIVFIASLTFEIPTVSDTFMFGIEDFELNLVDVARSRVVKPTVETFLVLAQLINHSLPFAKLRAMSLLKLALLVCFCLLNERCTFLEKQHFNFANIFWIFQAIIDFFLFNVAGVSFKLVPGE